jgi:transcriptional regulator with XRE-family HTH domain
MSRKKTHKSDYFLFGNNISKIATANGGRYAFAASLDVVYDTVRRWCNGENLPDGRQLLLIADKFDVSIDWLLSTGQPKDHPCTVACSDELQDLCKDVKELIESKTHWGESLRSNIKSFKKGLDKETEPDKGRANPLKTEGGTR